MKKWEIDRIKRAIQSCKNKRHNLYEHRPTKATNAIKNEDTKIAALEKQTPKKFRVDDEGWICCRNCNETFYLYNQFGKRNKHCGNCGQALDWSDSK